MPPGRQHGHDPQRQQAITKVDEHVLATVALDPEPLPRTGPDDHQRHGQPESQKGEPLQRRPPANHDGRVAQARGIREADQEEPPRGEEQASEDDQWTEQRPRDVRRPHAHEAQERETRKDQTDGPHRLPGPTQGAQPWAETLGDHRPPSRGGGGG